MAIFEYFPVQIRKAAKDNMSEDEQVKMCFVAGSSMFSSKDYVVITSRRVLVMDERTIGVLGKSYVNIKENVPLDKITNIEIFKTVANKIFGQSNMGLQIERYKYLIKNGREKEIKAAVGEAAGLIPSGMRRVTPPDLPEMAQPQVLRHFTRLSSGWKSKSRISIRSARGYIIYKGRFMPGKVE